MSVVKWESWVYTKVNGGIVIDFTHELGRKGFDYAPIPELGKTPGLRHGSRVGMDDIRAMTALTQRSPMVIARTAFAGTPEQYEIAPEDRPFDFHFDQAQFRGQEDGSSRLEVYWGVPMASATFFEKDERTGIRAVCRVALADKESGKLMRSETELIYVEDGDRTEGSGFIPHLALLDVPPGEYTMDVRMQDQVDGEVGSYRKNLEVKAFPGGELRLSDIQMAWKVREGGLPDKFTKSGLNVLPMPTRIYKHGEPVFVYYEVYNLSRDDFGMTNYTVEYTIRSGKPPGAIQRIFRAFKGGREEEVSVAAQEQLGVKETETSYVELDLSAAMAGEVVLTVTVKDLVSGEEVSRESKFELAE